MSALFTAHPRIVGIVSPLLSFLLLLSQLTPAQAQETPRPQQVGAASPGVQAVVINEIHYRPESKVEWIEFVELYNASALPVSLANWTLGGGIEFAFPFSTTIEPQGFLVIAKSPQAVRGRFGISALGPFRGNLGSDGERLELRNYQADLIGAVEYNQGFPWPTVRKDTGDSIQLVNPQVDNSKSGYWRSAAPTPGAVNAVWTQTFPPTVSSVQHDPLQPRSGNAVRVTVKVGNDDEIADAQIGYQTVLPGAYIAIDDPAYSGNWTWLPMQKASPGILAADIPPTVQRNRSLIRYRISLVATNGVHLTLPFADDPQPNFAYFVYDGVPPWNGSVDGSANGRQAFEFGAMRPVPVVQFIAKQRDVADALFLPPSTLRSGYMDSEARWRGTLVCGGEVYDHVSFRSRGKTNRYVVPKRDWRIEFTDGHPLRACRDSAGRASRKESTLNLAGVMDPIWWQQRGQQGLFESAGFRLFNMAGVPASTTDFIHLRVVEGAKEEGTNQYGGDFWGLYLALEQPDGDFLREHQLPDANIYKAEDGGFELSHVGRDGPADLSEVVTFMSPLRGTMADEEWWAQNLDIEGYVSYRSVIEFVRHYDTNIDHNYFLYRDPNTAIWSVIPWDLECTWQDSGYFTAKDESFYRLLALPGIDIQYQNRLRELRDLLLNQEQVYALLDDLAAQIDTAAGMPTMVQADRARWDYDPIHSSRYVDRWSTRTGAYYAAAPDHTFRGMVELMKAYVVKRTDYIDSVILTDRAFPSTPALSYRGAAGFPADALAFSVGDYSDPQGSGNFSSMEWRVAEVTNPNAPAYDPATARMFEIDPVWESGENPGFVRDFTIPQGVIKPGHDYRVRVRMKDNTGRWSHWSAPVEFVAAGPIAPQATSLSVTEIMYDAPNFANIPGDKLEFVEIYNEGPSNVNLHGMRISGGIKYVFRDETILAPKSYLVLASDSESFARRYSFAPFGDYEKDLNNNGDEVFVTDAWDRSLVQIMYGKESPWPNEAGGQGRSIVYRRAAGPPSDPQAWRASTAPGGSPGAADPLPVLINEVRLLPESMRAVELYNPNNEPANIGGWFLSDQEQRPRKNPLAVGATIPPYGYLVVEAAGLATGANDGLIDWTQTGQGRLVLSSADPSGRLTGYRTSVEFGPAEPGISYGRYVDSQGTIYFTALTSASFGAPNAYPRIGPVIISAILYAPVSGEEYIELTNISGETVRLFEPDNPFRSWILVGGDFVLPAGVELKPGQRLLVVPAPPEQACSNLYNRGLTRVMGPYTSSLNDAGDWVALLRPVATAGGESYAVVDSVGYEESNPWPNAAAWFGAALRREPVNAFGPDPSSWRADLELPGPGTPSVTEPFACSFRAWSTAQGALEALAWWVGAPQEIQAYKLWRGTTMDRASATLIADLSAPQSDNPNDAGYAMQIEVDRPEPKAVYIYWLEGISGSGVALELGVTSTARDMQYTNLPIAFR